MTKRDLIKFLERKQREKQMSITHEYQVLREEILQRTYAEIGLTALAEKMQTILEEASNLWKSWMQKHENTDWIQVNSNYYSIIAVLNGCAHDNNAMFKRLTGNELRVNPAEIELADKEYVKQQHCVNNTFIAVITTVQQMKNAKQAVVYLKELGFDLSELENIKPDAKTALMVQIDTRYLFTKAA